MAGTLQPGRSGARAEPIDFAHEMVLAVFAGAGSFSGYRVDIFSVAREGGSIVARYRREPVRGLAMPNAAPYQIVAVPRDQRKVRFIEGREHEERRSD